MHRNKLLDDYIYDSGRKAKSCTKVIDLTDNKDYIVNFNQQADTALYNKELTKLNSKKNKDDYFFNIKKGKFEKYNYIPKREAYVDKDLLDLETLDESEYYAKPLENRFLTEEIKKNPSMSKSILSSEMIMTKGRLMENEIKTEIEKSPSRGFYQQEHFNVRTNGNYILRDRTIDRTPKRYQPENFKVKSVPKTPRIYNNFDSKYNDRNNDFDYSNYSKRSNNKSIDDSNKRLLNNKARYEIIDMIKKYKEKLNDIEEKVKGISPCDSFIGNKRYSTKATITTPIISKSFKISYTDSIKLKPSDTRINVNANVKKDQRKNFDLPLNEKEEKQISSTSNYKPPKVIVSQNVMSTNRNLVLSESKNRSPISKSDISGLSTPIKSKSKDNTRFKTLSHTPIRAPNVDLNSSLPTYNKIIQIATSKLSDKEKFEKYKEIWPLESEKLSKIFDKRSSNIYNNKKIKEKTHKLKNYNITIKENEDGFMFYYNIKQ